MELITSDEKKYVDIGGEDVWKSVYSTVLVRLADISNDIALALQFLKNGYCEHSASLETARQMNLVRDGLSRFSPELMVYDYNDLNRKASWMEDISPVITSCANLYITADGKDLLYELVAILTYSYYLKKDISIAGIVE